MSDPDHPAIPADELGAVFGDAADDCIRVSVERIHEPVVSTTVGIWRVRVGDRSAILKLIGHTTAGHPNWRSGADPDHWLYWRREALPYESGLLDALPPGLRAASCLHLADRADGTVALWLEDVHGLPGSDWTLAHYETAARDLGRLQGSVAAHALPSHEWLSRDWLRKYLAQRDADFVLVDDAELWRHPLLAHHFSVPPIERIHAMRRDQTMLLDALDALPRTLCHLDVHPGNLFSDTSGATVAIDWASVGIGAIGEDAGNLIPDAVLDFHVAPDRIRDLDAAITSGYRTGLHDSGWTGAAAPVRTAMLATIAAKYAWIAPAMLRAIAEDRPLLNGRPIVETIRIWAPTVDYLLECADEARRLIATAS